MTIDVDLGGKATKQTKQDKFDKFISSKLYDELGWDKLSDRCRLHKLQLFYKMDNHLAPDYLCNLLPPHIGEVSSYPLRNTDNYTQIHSRTALYGSSFLPSAIHEWNKLPTEPRNAESQDMFKALLTDTKNRYHITTSVVIVLNK